MRLSECREMKQDDKTYLDASHAELMKLTRALLAMRSRSTPQGESEGAWPEYGIHPSSNIH